MEKRKHRARLCRLCVCVCVCRFSMGGAFRLFRGVYLLVERGRIHEGNDHARWDHCDGTNTRNLPGRILILFRPFYMTSTSGLVGVFRQTRHELASLRRHQTKRFITHWPSSHISFFRIPIGHFQHLIERHFIQMVGAWLHDCTLSTSRHRWTSHRPGCRCFRCWEFTGLFGWNFLTWEGGVTVEASAWTNTLHLASTCCWLPVGGERFI